MKRFLASEKGPDFAELSQSAKMTYIIGLLICNKTGFIANDDLDEAVKDPDVRWAASVVAGRVGLFGPRTSLDRYA
jgi:hypothetical protein